MLGYVADVHRPIFVPSGGLERHLLLLFGTSLGLLQAVELAVNGEDASAGTGAEVDPYLRQRRRDAERAELGILLELPDLVHRPQVYLADAFGSYAGPVLQPRFPLLDPASEDVVDSPTAGFQVGGYGGVGDAGP